MYILESEESFDSAHFLADYDGKCKNIHGHRWTIRVSICGDKLQEKGAFKGMIVDFRDIKMELKNLIDYFDHSLIIEKNSMRKITLSALKTDGFRIIEVNFRPTAENFSKYFYEYFEKRGFDVEKIMVYETTNNCAAYTKGVKYGSI